MGGGPAKRAHPPHREWAWHEKGDWLTMWQSYDWMSIRRGRQIYTEVFAPCHSLEWMTFNHFQSFMTKEEIKQLAASYDVVDDDPDPATGLPVTRPGKANDLLPMPFPNEVAAAAANNGAAPPDLRQVIYASEGGADYIFSLLTGYKWSEYMEVPPFVTVKTGQFFNPYFKGGVLAMPPPLSDGLVDYEDGTPATTSQMAKDVVNFLQWVIEPQWDERRILFQRGAMTTFLMFMFAAHLGVTKTAFRPFTRHRFRFWKKPF